jgi:HK97 family phage prohead protease
MPAVKTTADAYLRLEIKAISEAGAFEGMLSTYGNEDLGGDVIQRGAFSQSLQTRGGVVRILLDHDTTKRAGTGYITETPEGLHCRGVLNLESPYGQQAYAEVRFYQDHGPAMELSIGYKTRKDRWEQNRRVILEGDLWEGSLVCFAMNPQAFVTSVKMQEGGMEGAQDQGTRTPPEIKEAAPFERLYQWMMLWEARYRMADALWSSVQSILEDTGLDEAGQTAAAEESLGQFTQAVLTWMRQYRDFYAAPAATTMSAHLSLEFKAGRVLSARNKQLVTSAVEALSALLKAADPANDDEDDSEEGEKQTDPELDTLSQEALNDADAAALVGLAAEMQSFLGGRKVSWQRRR